MKNYPACKELNVFFFFWFNDECIHLQVPINFSGKARIRVQLSAAHSLEEVDRCVDAFITIGRELKVIQ